MPVLKGGLHADLKVIVFSLGDETVLFSSDQRIISNFPTQSPWFQTVFKNQINLKNANSLPSSEAEIKCKKTEHCCRGAISDVVQEENTLVFLRKW